MDERDIRLLKAISDLETGSPERLHEETDIPVSTIHYRLNNLRDAGIIKNDLYDIDLEKVGLGVTVLVELLTDYSGPHHTFQDKILDVEGVTQAYFTMGETDFIVVAHLSGREMVERLITDFEQIDEVERTNSTFVVSTLRDSSRVLQNYELETLLDELLEDE
ncbi:MULTISPECIES: Lrp/AsnC family transcriptional regulator [Halogeometricum]|uniref:Lrp/AsnC family transcriptional regulator n=2 Tax=Halogeometricum TaxID=60846 RepID=A0ABU2FVP1_9EURY|nr:MULTISPECIES: Lrp/AsnC family transcriptional regulator [unclassified Halogeometricum]MDS0292580.1 Lrp/AsnC family transcriptional regulator [Halogeometricum sp. S3BR5-2]MDS0299012.1 Lrp/AsnC family transcriptional regulator [Halogeometricum sp. S1BR25-6]